MTDLFFKIFWKFGQIKLVAPRNLPIKLLCLSLLQLADSSCIYVNKIMHEVDELTQIVPDVIGDPTLPRSEDHPCPKCKHREAVFFQVRQCRMKSNSNRTILTFNFMSNTSSGKGFLNHENLLKSFYYGPLWWNIFVIVSCSRLELNYLKYLE